MKCLNPRCSNEANLHYSTILVKPTDAYDFPEQFKHVDVCDECAEFAGMDDPNGFSMRSALIRLRIIKERF